MGNFISYTKIYKSSIKNFNVSIKEHNYENIKICGDNIKNGTFESYSELKIEKTDQDKISSVVFFYEKYFDRLFILEPTIKNILNNFKVKVSFLSEIIKILIDLSESISLNDKNKLKELKKDIKNIAENH